MLIGIAFLIGAALLGTGVVRRLPPMGRRLNDVEQATWGMVLGWMLTTLGAYLSARALGGLTFRLMLGFTVVVWIAVVGLWLSEVRRISREGLAVKTLWRPEYTGLVVVVTLFAPIYFRLFSSHMLQPGLDGVYSGGSAWYDLPFHLALTTSFAYGNNVPPIYTPFPPAPLLYPFLSDFQTAVLVVTGMTLRSALLLTSIPLAVAFTALLYFFAYRLIHTWTRLSETVGAQISATLATIIFLLNGGLGFYYFWEDWRNSGKTLPTFWSQLGLNYTNLGDRDLRWANFIADGLLPQRSILFGFPIALMIFSIFAIIWRNWDLDENKKDHWCGVGLLLGAGTITGLTPLFHAHVYMGLGLLSGALFLIKPRRQWVAFWAPAIVLAAPYLVNVLGHISDNGFVRFQPGWRGHSNSVWIWYWLRNIGLPTLVIIPAWFAIPALWRRFYLAFILLLVFSLLVVVSPNYFDNIKLIYLWYVPTSVIIAAGLVRLASVSRYQILAKSVATVLTLLCIASGLLALQFERTSHQLLFSTEEMAAVKFAREQTPPRALFLTAPTIHQPILSLAGRPIVRGDEAWLWSHGYDFAEREADVRSIYAGTEEARSLIAYYGIDYIYVGPAELQAGVNEEFFELLPLIYHSPGVRIYDVAEKDLKTEPPATVLPREFSSRLDKDPHQFLVKFPRVGYAVYRLYRTAFGRDPRFNEFVGDLKLVGRELYVGREGWQQVLENNKDALARTFAERVDFRGLYEGKSDEYFIDALIANVRVAPDGELRRTLLASLADKSASRGSVLRQVSQAGRGYGHDYNRAYLLTHYFAYLRRNPDDAPDHNLAGFNFWLEDLNNTGDYRSLTRVFLESGEYKGRRN